MMHTAAAIVVGVGSLLGAQAERVTHENLHATLWMQTSAEYSAVAMQTYAAATERIEEIAAERDPRGLAIVLDIDETVLDNSPYQARLVRDNTSYDSDSWGAWVEERAAEPIPGAPEFIARARDLGFAVVYITNRKADRREHTLANMRAVADPKVADSAILYRGERGWTSDKQARRDAVSTRAEIVMLIGDDLGDFVSPVELGDRARKTMAELADAKWGTSWFMLPNPTYGKWERSLYDFESLGDAEKLEAKYGKLRP